MRLAWRTWRARVRAVRETAVVGGGLFAAAGAVVAATVLLYRLLSVPVGDTAVSGLLRVVTLFPDWYGTIGFRTAVLWDLPATALVPAVGSWLVALVGMTTAADCSGG